MKKLLLSISIAIYAIMAVAQQDIYDPKAKQILDKLSAETKKMEPFKATFLNKLINTAADMEETIEGNIIVSGSKFQLNYGQVIMYSNGHTQWNYMPDVAEVEITNAGQDDGGLNPADIFSMYESGFKYKFKEETTVGAKTYYIIELYPENIDQSYSRIQLLIDKKTNLLYTFRSYGKDGNHYEIILKDIKQITLSGNEFEFDLSAHPDVFPVDLR